MEVFRISKSLDRAEDLSGTGAYKVGGRWNSEKVYMLYTSENRSLAFLENLAHFNSNNKPPRLYITTLHIKEEVSIYRLPESNYPKNWRSFENQDTRALGNMLMNQRQFLAIQVRSAVFPEEYNYLLNPLFDGYHQLVEIKSVDFYQVDERFLL